MKIDATTFAKLPDHLKALFIKAPNPGSDEVIGLFPYSKSGAKKPHEIKGDRNVDFIRGLTHNTGYFQASEGSASRFFYGAKASKADRDEGLEGFQIRQTTGGGGGIGDYLSDVDSASGKFGSEKAPAKNHHPTVKPTDLMRYLCRLITPPGGVVLDPFMGSGSTGKAAYLEGFKFIGIERDPDYLQLAKKRINHVAKQVKLF